MIKKLLLTIFLGLTLLNAKTVSPNQINPNLLAIKLASLKDYESLKEILRFYPKYDIYVQKADNWDRVYIVNIPHEEKDIYLQNAKEYDDNVFFIDVKSRLAIDTNKKQQIDPNLSAIKAASFKDESSVQRFINKFKQFDIFVEDTGDWKRVYIVNIPNIQKESDFKNLKQFDKNVFFVDMKEVLSRPTKQQFVKRTLAKKEKITTDKKPIKLVEKTIKTPIIKKEIPKKIKKVEKATKEEKKETPIIVLKNKETDKIKKTKDNSVFVRVFEFEGNSAIKTQELKKIVEAKTYMNLTLEELKILANEVTKYYKDKGYFISKAFIPKQNMQNGIIKIAISEGKLGKFILNNNSEVKDETILKILNEKNQNKIVNAKDLTKRVNKVNQLAGVKVVDTKITPSKEPNTIDFIVTTKGTKKANSYVSLDNYGSRYEGEYNLNVGTNIKNLSGAGDSLDIYGSISSSAKTKSISTTYSRYLGYKNLTGGINLYVSKYELENIPNYESLGDSSSIGIFLKKPINSTNFSNSSLKSEYRFKKVKSDNGLADMTQLSDKELHLLELSLTDQRVLQTAYPSNLYMNASLTLGNLSLVSDLAKENDIYLDSEGFFSKINADINYNVALSDKYTIETTLKAQKSLNRNLDASEDFVASGSSGVKAYEDSELMGDDGYFISLALKYRLPTIYTIIHDTSIFIDHAKVWKNMDTFNDEKNTRTLNAVGVGYSMSFSDFFLKSTYAHGFGSDSTPESEAEFSTSKNKFLVQMYYPF